MREYGIPSTLSEEQRAMCDAAGMEMRYRPSEAELGGLTGETNHIVGENGTAIPGSKTTGQVGKTERIDVENPLGRDGNIHYYEPNGTKWYYNIKGKILFNEKDMTPAPPKFQRVLQLEWAKKALKILGE